MKPDFISNAVYEFKGPTEEGQNPEEWPYPTEYILSPVRGQMLIDVLAKLGFFPTEDQTVWLLEETISTGYSEYTTDENIEFCVIIDGVTIWDSEIQHTRYSKAYKELPWNKKNSVNQFLNWLRVNSEED